MEKDKLIDRINKAKIDMEEARQIHVIWAVYQLRLAEKEDCKIKYVGDIEHHLKWAYKYENILELLNQISY